MKNRISLAEETEQKIKKNNGGHTLVDAHADGELKVERFVERHDVSDFRRKSGRVGGASPVRTVSIRLHVSIRYHADVSQVRKTDDVIFPRIPRLANVELSTHTRRRY